MKLKTIIISMLLVMSTACSSTGTGQHASATGNDSTETTQPTKADIRLTLAMTGDIMMGTT